MDALRSVWARFRTLPQLGQAGIGCSVLLVLLLCSCGGLALAIGASGAGASTSAHGSPSTAARTATHVPSAHATATRKPAPTATRTPKATATTAPTVGAVLGGTGTAFITRYGPLTSQSAPGDLHFRQYAGVAQDFLIVDLAEHFGDTPGNDAESILVAGPPSPSQPWGMSTAQAMCSIFLPSDAQKVNDVPVTTGGALTGEDVIYTSATLAKTFPASVFVDANQNPVAPGTFDVLYLYDQSGNPSSTDSCQLLLGSQQEQSS